MRDLKASVIAVVVLTIVLGLALPALATGFAQVVFPSKADSSLIKVNGRVVGSKLAAQPFTKPGYFHGRPSGTTPADNAAGTTFTNLGPTNPDLAKAVRKDAQAILELERPYNPGLTIGDIPVDAVTTSGSGIDPGITPAYAHLQARRVAALRNIPLPTVERLIQENTDGRSLGFFGEPAVNVLELNLAVDRSAGS
jgi:K+-transporting ATPase ATPase C chain